MSLHSIRLYILPVAYNTRMTDTSNIIRSPHPARSSSGNMLAMVVLVGFILIAVIVIGIAAMLMLFAQQRGKQNADEVALTLAQVLNRDDRQGQMNTLVERSRELVYTSRKAFDDAASEEMHNMEPLLRDLLDESRTGAHYVEKTRQSLSTVVLDDLSLTARQFSDKLNQNQSFNLNVFNTAKPRIKALEIGSIGRVNSNASVSPGLPELRLSDEKLGLLDNRSGLYFGNINACLPGADADLDFKFSSLPAPVGTSIPGARLTSNGVFKLASAIAVGVDVGKEKSDDIAYAGSKKKEKSAPDQIPSAVKVELAVTLSAGSGQELKDQLSISTSATATGALPAPDLVPVSK